MNSAFKVFPLLAGSLSLIASASPVEIPVAYKIVISPGPPVQIPNPAGVLDRAMRINNRGNFLVHETDGVKRTVLLGQRVPGVDAGYRYAQELGTLRLHKLPGLIGMELGEEFVESGDVRDSSLETYFTSPVEAVGTALGTQSNPRRRAMSWQVSATGVITPIDFGGLSGRTESVALGVNTFAKCVGFGQNIGGSGRVGFFKSNLSSDPLTFVSLSNPGGGEAVAINESGLIVGRDGNRASFWISEASSAQIVSLTSPNRRSRLVSLTNNTFSNASLPRAVGVYYTSLSNPSDYSNDSMTGGFAVDLPGNLQDFGSHAPSAINDQGTVAFQKSDQNPRQNRLWFPNAQGVYDSSGVRILNGQDSPANSMPFTESLGHFEIESIQDINNNNQIVGSVIGSAQIEPASPVILSFIGTAIYNPTGVIDIPVSFEGISSFDNSAYAADHPTMWYRVYQGQVLVDPATDQSDSGASVQWMSGVQIQKVGGQLVASLPNIRLRGLVTLLLRPSVAPVNGRDKSRYLTRTLLVNATSGQVTSAPVHFLTGDIDRDNSVTVFDYDILSQNFDVTSADPNWNTPGSSGHSPRECDLDEDGSITVFDYDLLSTRFDKKGEVY